jgi:capsular exopolysaccharide synthesis family protein
MVNNMELQRYLEILKRRALVIFTVVIVTLLVVAVASTYIIPSVYEAQTVVRVLLDVGVSDFVMREDYSTRLLNTYAEILQGEPMLTKAIERMSLPASSSSLIKDVTVEVVPDTELLTITVQSRDKGLARDLANTLPTLLTEYSQEMYVGSSKSTKQIVDEQLVSLSTDLEEIRQQRDILIANMGSTSEIDALNSQIEDKEEAYDLLLEISELASLSESLRANSIAVVAPATLPIEPANKLGLYEIAIALVIGLLGGIGFALVLENLDTRIHNWNQLEHFFGLPVIGIVPPGTLTAWDLDIWDLDNENAPKKNKLVLEAYRLLCANFLASKKKYHEQEQVNLEKILVTNADPKEGKSTVVANLARVLANQGQKVLLVESDLRQPILTEKFGLDGHTGIGNLLNDQRSIDDVELEQMICTTDQLGLRMVDSGPKVEHPAALLASPSVEKLLEYVKDQAEVTLLDTPAVLGVADVTVLAPKVDGIIMVVWQSISKREVVSRALQQLYASQARVLGLVFLEKSAKDWVG